jgi:hypothetical protein
MFHRCRADRSGCGPGLTKAATNSPVRACAAALERQSLAELTRHEHRGTLSQLFDLAPADIPRYFDVVGRVGPEQPRVFGVDHRELDLQEVTGSPPGPPPSLGSPINVPVRTA